MKIGENIILIIFIFVLSAGGYFWYTYLRPAPVIESQPAAVGEESLQDFLMQVTSRLSGLRMDTEFLSSPQFTSLQDLTPVVTLPDVVGRSNPFLPIPGVQLEKPPKSQ